MSNFGYRTLGFGSIATAAGAAPQEYVIETTITVGNTDWKGAYNRGWDGAWDQGAGGGGIGSIADDSIPDNRDNIERCYVQGHNEHFFFTIWSSSASGGSPASYTAWTFLEIVNGATITRYAKDSYTTTTTFSSSNGAGAFQYQWNGPDSGAGLNSDGDSVVVFGAASNTVTLRVANNE